MTELLTRPQGARGGGEVMCGCGHEKRHHAQNGKCQEWWRYPDVLDPRQCGCTGVWEKKDK